MEPEYIQTTIDGVDEDYWTGEPLDSPVGPVVE